MAKHIVIDARIIDTTTGRYCRGLLDGLERLNTGGLRFTALVPSASYTAWQKLYPSYHFVPCDIKNYSLAEQFKLRKVLDELNPDLVHFSMPQQPVFYKTSPVITTFHDLTLLKTYNSDKNWLIFHFKQLVGRWVFRQALKKSALILTPSNYTKEDILQTFRHVPALANKISTVYLAGKLPKSVDQAPATQAKPKRDFTPPKNYLLYVGNQADYKNIPRLMAAHQKLLRRFPDLYLVLASPPGKATEANQHLAKKHGCRNVVFTGWLSNEGLKKLYQNCVCYVFPSLMEGFGLPGLEAMGMGAPVAAANATSLPEIYGEAAIYFNPKDTDDTAAKLVQVLTDRRLRLDLVKHGQKQFAKYNWRKMAEETLQNYQKII